MNPFRCIALGLRYPSLYDKYRRALDRNADLAAQVETLDTLEKRKHAACVSLQKQNDSLRMRIKEVETSNETRNRFRREAKIRELEDQVVLLDRDVLRMHREVQGFQRLLEQRDQIIQSLKQELAAHGRDSQHLA